MKAESPVRPTFLLAGEPSSMMRASSHHGRQSRDLSVLLADLSRRRSRYKVQIQDSRDQIVLEMLSTHVVDLDIHARARQKEHAVSAIFTSMVEVYRMVPVQVCAFWDSVAVS